MKSLKKHFGSLIMCLFELIVGVLLLVDPIGFTSGIVKAFGIVLVIVGFGSVLKYFRMDPVDAAVSQDLSKGLTALLAGVFCTVKSEWFVVTFPVLTLIYGAAILITGLAKIQWMVDIIRLKKGKWFLAGISAVLSIACGVVIVTSPFSSTAVLWMFTGITLIVEAAFDLIALIFGAGKAEKESDAVEAEPVEE